MSKIDEILGQLNEEQIGPVLQTEGAVLVLAGAGSGKTRVLTSRIAYLAEKKGIPERSILAITFTNKAANEMKERLSQIIDTSEMWVCTIHSMCVRILRRYGSAMGIEPNFSIYSETERSNVIKKAFLECDYDDEKFLKDVKWHVGNAKMLGLSPEEYAKEYAFENRIDDIVKVYSRYLAHLKSNNALDFDDLLSETRRLLKTNEEVRTWLGERFRYILVDEFQDTNGVQFEIVRLLASRHGNLFAVGDDDQSIYGWRGAEIENILSFEKSFPGAKVFKLERNYRSSGNILKLANAVIKHNGRRKNKTLWTDKAEGEKVVVQEAEQESGEARFAAYTIAGLMNRGYRYSDFAVLMRLNALTRSFEQEFTADGIPYKVFGGFKFYERKEIKDLLAYLRTVNNPFDSEAIVRIVNFPKRGIGKTTVERLENYAYQTELSVFDALLDLDELGFTGSTKQKLETFRDQLKGWIAYGAEASVVDLVKRIVDETNMKQAYADDSDESINKRANIDEFVNAVEEYCKLNPEATLTDYLNQVTLSSDTDDMDDGNCVTLATIHSVKGLEFPVVFLCGLEDGVMPVSRAQEKEKDLEEERRLMYVAVTRAKERLYLTRSKSRYLYGKREPTMRSRFLKELSSELELPRESSSRFDRSYSDDDPEFYGNASYGAGRFGGYPRTSFRQNSEPKRSVWQSPAQPRPADFRSSPVSAQKGAFTYGGVGSSASKPASMRDVSVYKEGVKVVHPKFGNGTIIAVRGQILDVAFENLGVKQLSAALAPLTVK